jgi:glutamyl-tRNA synthetase
MSKRDKDKAARHAAKQSGLHTTPVPEIEDAEFKAWLGDAKKQLPTFSLEKLAEKLDLTLPEINVDDFQRAGYLPEVVCNYIALLGWSPGSDVEKFDNEFLKEKFDLPRIVKTAARFDRKKLLAFNTDAITAMEPAEFKRRWRAWCESEAPELLKKLSSEQFDLMAEANQPRSKTFRDALGFSSFLLVETGEIAYDKKAVKKFIRKNEGQGLQTLGRLREMLPGVEPWAPGEIELAVERFAAQHELGMGAVAQPLRIACTGTSVSPPIGATLASLGRENVLARIDRALEQLAEPAGA